MISTVAGSGAPLPGKSCREPGKLAPGVGRFDPANFI